MRTHEVIVVGLGGMGSAACYELAARGVRVLGIDRFAPPHTLGSTHGRTRILREAYFEHPRYVPLVRRALERWQALESTVGRPLFVRTGGLMIGPPDGELVRGSLASACAHDIPHEMLARDEIVRRFPTLRPPPGAVALYELRAGLLFPESCIESYLALASRHGATLVTNEVVTSWSADDGVVRVRTDRGAYEAGRLLLAAGAWLPQLVPDASLPLEVERQMLHWFAPASDAESFRAERWPLALWELEGGRLFATFPDTGDGVKAGIHHEGEITTPERVRRATTPDEDREVRALMERLVPEAAGALVESRVCLYTNTPDQHFLIDWHPSHDAVLIASPCSGHGFKFASAIGELLAQMLTGASPASDPSFFSLARFAD